MALLSSDLLPHENTMSLPSQGGCFQDAILGEILVFYLCCHFHQNVLLQNSEESIFIIHKSLSSRYSVTEARRYTKIYLKYRHRGNEWSEFCQHSIIASSTEEKGKSVQLWLSRSWVFYTKSLSHERESVMWKGPHRKILSALGQSCLKQSHCAGDLAHSLKWVQRSEINRITETPTSFQEEPIVHHVLWNTKVHPGLFCRAGQHRSLVNEASHALMCFLRSFFLCRGWQWTSQKEWRGKSPSNECWPLVILLSRVKKYSHTLLKVVSRSVCLSRAGVVGRIFSVR